MTSTIVERVRRRFTARSTVCRAPSAAMYLDQKGDVRACCWNSLHPLGNVTEAGLSDIWFGATAGSLRAAVDRHDYSLGCHACAQEIARGNDDLVFARTFDRLPRPGSVRYPAEISFAMSNTCNLQCVMCRGEWSSSIRLHREGRPPLPAVYGDDFFDELRDFLPHLSEAKFLGGEPFLEREAFRVWDLMSELGLETRCNVTTNATQWNARVERVLDSFPVTITVSIDGITASTYESIRVGADHATVMANIARFQDHARRRGTSISLTWCLMTNNWFEFADYLLFAEQLGCAAWVNTVPEPAEFDLEQLPLQDLRVVVDGLRRRAPSLVGRLERNRHVWDAQVRRLSGLLDARERGTEVWIGAPTDGPPQSDERAEEPT